MKQETALHNGQSNLTTVAKMIIDSRTDGFLDRDEEIRLYRAYQAGDHAAGQKIVQAHMPMVVKAAKRFSKNEEQLKEAIQNGNLGLMLALDKFDPDNGARFSTYAAGWMKSVTMAASRENFSLVKIGSTPKQKAMYYKLLRTHDKISQQYPAANDEEITQRLAEHFNTTAKDVTRMRGMLLGVASLDTPISSKMDEGLSFVDVLQSDAGTPEDHLIESDEANYRKNLLSKAFNGLDLTDRDRNIFVARRLTDPPVILETLAEHYNISRERVRQIEVSVFKKVSKIVLAMA